MNPTTVVPTTSTRPINTKRGGGWNAAMFIILVEIAERFCFYGIGGNLMTYLMTVLSYPMAEAAKNVNMWQGVAMICPILGAVVADSVVGRFTTVIISSFIYLFALMLLLLSASLPSLKHHRPFFFLSIYTLAIGEGGHKPSVQTFAADQFDDDTPEQRATKSSFFNFWYIGIAIGGSLGFGAVIFVQRSAGWGVGFGIPAGSMALAVVVFLSGIKFYRRRDYHKSDNVTNPYTRIAQVMVAAVRKRGVKEEECEWGVLQFDDDHVLADGSRKRRSSLARTNQYRFLDKATVIDSIDAKSHHRNPWRLCSTHQVEEFKLILRLIPIWLTLFPFSIVYAQLFTFLSKQADTLTSPLPQSFHLRPSYIPFFITVFTMLILLVLYDRFLTPFLRKITHHPTGITVLQRIGIGQFLCVMIMSLAAMVESQRLKVVKAHGLLDQPKVTVPMSVWWVMPHFLVLAVSEVFGVPGMQQLFYEQVPVGLRSMGAAAYLCTIGLGSFISSGIIVVVQAVTKGGKEQWLVDNVNRAHLDEFFWLLAGISGGIWLLYLWFASRFVYKTDELVLEEEDDGKLREIELA